MSDNEQVAQFAQRNGIRRYGISLRTYSVTEMDRLLRGETEPNHYRNVNGLLLPVRYDTGTPEVER